MPFLNNGRNVGLSQKEKSYLISRCELKAFRYKYLKNLAANAIKDNKIFAIHGSCNAVRKVLLERGWVEKIPPQRMNLNKIRNGSNNKDVREELERILLSSFVEKYNPNFIWRTNDERWDTTIDMVRDYYTLVNKLEIDAMWTSKQGLCSSLKRNYWFHIEDVAEVNSPRSYNISDCGEISDFVNDYRITACTSLLKWIVSMVSNRRQIFAENGQVSMHVMIFALNRCKDYLCKKQNKDIDCDLPSVSDKKWNEFLEKYYRVISKEEVIQCDKEDKLPFYLGYAKFLLKEIYKYRPQLSCEGCHNIWIIKPTHCSRGRGIRLASKLDLILGFSNKTNSKYVVQKYIEEPLLIHDTKSDIRQYYLVTSTYPLVIWMYRDCYLKFSSQKYSLKSYHESIHLTNNAVQKNYTNCKGRHCELPYHNMWDLDKYKNYLNNIGKEKFWDNIIYPGMKKSIIGIMLNCQDTLSVSKNRFELYGCDFILDKNYTPWLIEINSCPDLNNTTQVTAKICPAVVSDIIKVVIDYTNNRESSTGKFECIFRQPVTLPRFGNTAELLVRGYSLPPDYFYRGHVKVSENWNNPNTEQTYDINGILHKLKSICDSETIMAPPDESQSYAGIKYKDEYTLFSESEYETEDKTSKIENPNGFMDKITPTNSLSTSFYESLWTESRSKEYLKESVNCPRRASSLINIKLLLKNSFDYLNIEKNNRFSKLSEVSSNDETNQNCNPLDKFFAKLFVNQDRCTDIQNKFSYDNVLRATSKIITFIRGKEKEYLNKLAA